MHDYASRLLAASEKEFAGYQGSATAASSAADLSTGEIRIERPDWLESAIVSGAQRAPLGYVDPQGLVGLRKQYASFLSNAGYHFDEGNVLVTYGAKEALWVALIANTDEGHAVLLPRPGWTQYYLWAQALGARAHFYDPRIGNLVAEIAALFDQARPSVLILNSPNNPTGAEISERDFASIVELAAHYQVSILSDEVYRYYALQRPAGSVLGPLQAGTSRLLYVDSLSKMLGLAGLRIGFLLADRGMVKKLEVVRSSFGSCVSAVAQTIAQELLSHDQCLSWIDQIDRVCRQRLSTVGERLRSHGYEVESAGALYLWVRDPLAAHGQCTGQIVLGGTPARVAPGHLFGRPGYFRLCPIRDRHVLASVFPEQQSHEKEKV